MAAKVSFDSSTKIITVTEPPDVDGFVDIDVKVDLYSDGKEDWITDASLNKFRFFMRAVGGDDLPGSKVLGSTFFLQYGWRIRPYEASHTLRVNGNLYTDEGDSPFISTVGTYNVMVISTVSSLVDSTVAQLSEIEYASFGDVVTVDIVNGTAGTEYPQGTPRQPVSNMVDALTIAAERGFTGFSFIGNATIDSGFDYSNKTFIGQSVSKTTLTVSTSANVIGCTFKEATVTGILDGDATVSNCNVLDLQYINGEVEESGLSGTLTLAGNKKAVFNNCYTTDQDNPPTIDMGGTGQSLAMPNYSGLITVTNLSDSDQEVGIGINHGMVVLADTVTAGTIIVSGIGLLMDSSNGTASVNSDGLISKATISSAVWDEGVANHVIAGSSGQALRHMSYGDAIWIDTSGTGTAGTDFPTGTMNQPVSNMTDAMTIAAAVGLTSFRVKGTLVVTMAHTDWSFYGVSSIQNDIIVLTGTDITGSYFNRVTVTGVQVGSGTNFQECILSDISGLDCVIAGCGLANTIALGGIGTSVIGNQNNFASIPTTIDMVGVGRVVSLECSGQVLVTNMGASSLFSVGFGYGDVELDSTCTDGSADISGNATVTDNSGSGCTVNNRAIPKSIWSYDIADETTTDSAAMYIKKALGLIHENIVIDNNVYDINNQLISSRVRIFANSTDAANATSGGTSPPDPEPIETYLATATWAGLNQMSLFKQVTT